MSEVNRRNRPHIVLSDNATPESFTAPGGGGGGKGPPMRNRASHGGALLDKIRSIEPELTSAVQSQQEFGLEEGLGLQIEFESFPDVELAFESLARDPSGIELRNVRYDGKTTFATVFVPDGKLAHFEKLVLAYLDPGKDGKKGPANQKLLNAISEIRTATIDALWTDDPDQFPVSEDEALWWEVWLPVRGDRAAITRHFVETAQGLDFRVGRGVLQFPERTVITMYGSRSQLERSILTLNSIAELRRAKETADFFDSLEPHEQPEWVQDLLSRLDCPPDDSRVPHVSVLDTGVNANHPLLRPLLASTDMHTVNPAWGVNDSHGHGTEMSGLSLYADLVAALESNNPLQIRHRLESVKLLPGNGANSHDPAHHGYLTVDAVQQLLVSAPDRKRVLYTSVTAKDGRDRGRPSAWSAAIDRLASDAESQGEQPKLFVLAAGNILDQNLWTEHPASNTTEGIHDPAQAWNALTVGAMTNLTNITEDDAVHYDPIASKGDLSPFSTTSATWQAHWPLKPDIVMEGGNAANDGLGAVTMPSLRLLTTSHDIQSRLFTTTNATSAASALVAKMSAELMVHYERFWPETIRGLLVHSARWTPAMESRFLPIKPKKSDFIHLIRHCGFGVPDMELAMYSANDSLTLISESSLNPFRKDGSKGTKTKEMNIHQLPWPLEQLEALGQVEVEMRVSLSYFIEPNPSARGVTSRYRYESHGLRFDVKRPAESEQQFKSRLNVAARDEEEGTHTSGSDNAWLLGTNARHRGSLHSDIWRGTAADLASRGMIGVYPALGWWRSRPTLQRYDSNARYALIVSIHVEKVDIDIDIYTPVANQVGLQVEV